MTTKIETKHARFLRLAQRRLERAMNELRLVSQLGSRGYEYCPHEAEEIVRHLDKDVRHIAEVFGVEYATRIGKAGTKTTHDAQAIGTPFARAPVLDEVEAMKVLDHIRAGRTEEADRILRAGIIGGQPA